MMLLVKVKLSCTRVQPRCPRLADCPHRFQPALWGAVGYCRRHGASDLQTHQAILVFPRLRGLGPSGPFPANLS